MCVCLNTQALNQLWGTIDSYGSVLDGLIAKFIGLKTTMVAPQEVSTDAAITSFVSEV